MSNQSSHTFPGKSMTLAPLPQRSKPESVHLVMERTKFTSVAWHPLVTVVPKQDDSQPLAHHRDGVMQTASELFHDIGKFCSHLLPYGLPKHHNIFLSGFAAHVGESKKVEGLGLAVASLLAIIGRITTKLDKPGFVGMQVQIKIAELTRPQKPTPDIELVYG